MDDSKTKTKIRILDLLVLIAMRTQKIDNIKSILMGEAQSDLLRNVPQKGKQRNQINKIHTPQSH